VVIFAASIAGYLFSKYRALGPNASPCFAAFFASSAGISANTFLAKQPLQPGLCRHIDHAVSVENQWPSRCSASRMWTSSAATSQSLADDVESGRTNEENS
jgi:hypothetical protein